MTRTLAATTDSRSAQKPSFHKASNRDPTVICVRPPALVQKEIDLVQEEIDAESGHDWHVPGGC